MLYLSDRRDVCCVHIKTLQMHRLSLLHRVAVNLSAHLKVRDKRRVPSAAPDNDDICCDGQNRRMYLTYAYIRIYIHMYYLCV